MPLSKKGSKILGHMQQQYGDKKGKSVFYASANKGTISGIHHDDKVSRAKKHHSRKGR